jgi:hypothetical protein
LVSLLLLAAVARFALLAALSTLTALLLVRHDTLLEDSKPAPWPRRVRRTDANRMPDQPLFSTVP